MIIVVMGVSGSGKSTVGQALAEALGWDFQEGDALHPPANIEKMHAGIPLDDADRAPWLERIAAWIADMKRRRLDGVVSCSALKRSYRDLLRKADADLRFVYLHLSRAELERRLRHREHFMPPSLLDSQLQALEPPSAGEPALTVDGEASLPQIVARACEWLAAG